MKHFKIPVLISCIALLAAFLWGGFYAFFLCLMLSILEITLSFDNALLNVGVFKEMSKIWQKRFLTWGILIAVFVTRLLLPVAIISLFTHLSIEEVFSLEAHDPKEYRAAIEHAKPSILAFGAMFLFSVYLKFMFDQKRKIYWLNSFEQVFHKIGKFKFSTLLLYLIALFMMQCLVPSTKGFEVFISGVLGVLVFLMLQGLIYYLKKSGKTLHQRGLVQFLYLEILDASFSLDSVLSAFAISQDIVIILLGLSVGALFVRTMTVSLAHHNTIKNYRYLEHGAHYAIGALAALMFIQLYCPVSEIIIGLISVSIIGLSLLSSIKYNKKGIFVLLKH